MHSFFRRSLIVGLAVLVSQPAFAHAVLVESTPAAGTTVDGPAVSIDLRYNSRVDAKRSQLVLTKPDGSKAVVPIATDSAVDHLRGTATLAPGAYVLRWQVLAVDGHITRGDVPFTVTGH